MYHEQKREDTREGHQVTEMGEAGLESKNNVLLAAGVGRDFRNREGCLCVRLIRGKGLDSKLIISFFCFYVILDEVDLQCSVSFRCTAK